MNEEELQKEIERHKQYQRYLKVYSVGSVVLIMGLISIEMMIAIKSMAIYLIEGEINQFRFPSWLPALTVLVYLYIAIDLWVDYLKYRLRNKIGRMEERLEKDKRLNKQLREICGE